MEITLSIIIPIYNVEEYLEQCLESIYRLRINKEIILVNDDSPDDSHLIIEKYKNMFPKETIVINQKNQGLSGARNSGLKIATGTYISFVDSDDFIDTSKYEEIFKKGQDENLDIIIGSHIKYKNKKYIKEKIRNSKLEKLNVLTGKNFLEESLKLNSFKEEVWDDFYKRDFLIKNNLKFKEKLLHEDVLFSIKALILAERVKYYNIEFYIYRQREGSIMSSLNIKNSQHKLYIVNEILNYVNEKKIKINGLENFLIGILYSIFKSDKRINLDFMIKILKYNKKLSRKNYIKLLIMFFFSCRYKKIDLINI